MIGILDLGTQGLVQAALRESGHPVSFLASPEAALREAQRGRLEALVVETPTVDERCRELLAETTSQGLPTLVVARDRSVAAAVGTLRAGASDYLTAPFEYESLLRAVDRLVDESGSPPPSSDPEDPFITQDPEVQATLTLLRSVAKSDATILLQGESGTGKELLAQLVHRCSSRRDRELVTVNCAALPAGLLESELFGHERGSFTGAHTRVIGKFELAHGTTILLDEIGELEFCLQAKLLRVLQEKQVQRVGARRPIRVDFRLVVTTNRDLAAEVKDGRFREDLFYRLNVLPIQLTPLRERSTDVPLLLHHFAKRATAPDQPSLRFSDDALAELTAYAWPGNVRELQNLVERLSLTIRGRTVHSKDLRLTGGPTRQRESDAPAPAAVGTIREMERWLIVQTLTRQSGNRTRAARDLGISLRTLRNKIQEYRVIEPETLPRTGGAAAAARHVPGRSGPAAAHSAEAAR